MTNQLSDAPCDKCGYNGPNYYQPSTHKCAEPTAPSSDEVARAFSTLERYDTFHQYHTGYDSSAEIKTIRDHIAALEAEVSEQCRLHGIGSEREAKQMSEIQELEAKVKHLSDERQKLDKRIHNQRMALRENWTITEQRVNWLGKKQIHGRLVATDVLRSWSKSAKRCLDLEADNKRLRDSVTWLIPMAEGWAWEHPVGSNKDIIKQAKEALAKSDGKGGD